MSDAQFAIILIVALLHLAVGFLVFGAVCVVGNHLKAWLDYAKERSR